MFKAQFICLLFAFFSLAIARAEEGPSQKQPEVIHDGEAFTFYLENDSNNIGGPGSDEAYSNGFKFSYIYAEDKVPKWARSTVKRVNVLEQNIERTKVNFGVSLAQQLYTPNNTKDKNLIRNDRPYAGWLYVGLAVSLKEENVGQFFEMDIGTIGPSALGKQVQNNFHEWIDEPRVEGWENGLHNEPTLQFFYQKRFKALNTKSLDLFPYYGGGLGNVQIGGHIGWLLRLGVNMPDDFGPSRPSASDGDSFVSPDTMGGSKRFSYYGFAGMRGNASLRNIFLDGNSFESSHRVTKYPFTFETEFGFGMQVRPVGVVWRFVTRSPEFEERSRLNSFASVNITYFM